MRVMGLVFANINDRDVPELTTARSLASVPFAGRYRIIDFVLSNLIGASASTVGVITKHNFQSLMDHMGSGKYWDLARKNGGLVLLPPFGERSVRPYNSRMEALTSVLSFLKRMTEDILIMSDTDSVYNTDLNDAIDYFVKTQADMTLLYRKKTLKSEDNKLRMLLDVTSSGAIKGSTLTTSATGENNVFTFISIARREFVIRMVEAAMSRGFESFSRQLLPYIIANSRVTGYEISGYFASIDSLENYFKHSMELLNEQNRKGLFGVNNIYTKVRDSAPLKFDPDAKAVNSIIADGCVIEGTVKNSILFRGVHVGRKAVVENSIVFQNSDIGDRVKITNCVCDKNCVIKQGKTLSGCEKLPYFIPKNSVL